ncbi:hypothetical protein CC86DRAFT_456085 [Ophiobolus disseminans]|uniref:Nucleolar 27S pre-rRNA processing Urb2/Npa2 C-terminal domain-containing protein n=1 Tax=Ophiobolus disseminans TaxID=1469910 RepID=A0A6A6ZY88_9PLEO|nr:hypothetical protein CC86DRAFT_456085 [Ophiobolus disseminans]
MARSIPNPAHDAAPTRLRLQSVNHDFQDLKEQIRQVAHIIRLPDDWTTSTHHVVRARAEWVLRWILDKLKEETEVGTEARGTLAAWQLLECMIHILPVSRSAPHLRDAAFPTILEKTLVENFDKDLDARSVSSDGDAEMRNASESSETIHEETQPSRKRKRGTTEASPAKRIAVASADPASLFSALSAVLKLITDSTQTELMKMVIRTESDQASRILKFWLVAAAKLLAKKPADLDQLVDLSTVVELWELRVADPGDNTASSSEDFANECFVPTLQLVEALRNARALESSRTFTKAIDIAAQTLDKLLTRHLLAPARAAFLAERTADKAQMDSAHQEAATLSSNLIPLQVMLLQAAQIEDAGEALPIHMASSFKAIPYLLDLALRASPSRTPKSRLAEKPWIQAVFLSLIECVGCSLKTPPELDTSKTAVAGLQSAIEVLQSHSIKIDVAILKDLFWYHCGVKYPKRATREPHWGLIAALIEFDASMFVAEPRSSLTGSEHPTDLVEFLFKLISDIEFTGDGFAAGEPSKDNVDGSEVVRSLILTRIVVPTMFAFSRNRNLLGFIRQWDDQLVRSHGPENRKVLKEKTEPLWEDRTLTTALSEVFEQFLTQGQIAKLLEEHVKRMDELSNAVQAEEGSKIRKLNAYKKASSSALIIPAILESVISDDIVAALKTQLHSLLLLYITRVRDDRYSAHTRIASSWLTLCQLMAKLWPTEMNTSLQLQQLLLHPLIEQATEDLSAGRKSSDGRRIDSTTRAAVMTFLFNACDRLQTVSGSEKLVQSSVRKIVKSLSASQLEPEEHMKMLEMFCANFVQLLNHLGAEASRESFITLLSKLTTFDDVVAEQITRSLPWAVFEMGNSDLNNAYSSAVSSILGPGEGGRLNQIAIMATISLRPTAMSREKREAILDLLTNLSSTGFSDLAGLLSSMNQFMDIPNASAKISTNGAVFYEIADQLQKQGLRSRRVLQSLQHLCQKTLGHIIPNQTQAQSRAFLADYQKRLNSMTQAPGQVSPVGLALLRATILEQKDAQLLSVKQYVALLKKCLMDEDADVDNAASFEEVLDAFVELFPALLADPNLLKTTTAWLRTWINENADLESFIASSNSVSTEVAGYVALLHKLVAKYKLYPDTQWLVVLTIRLLRESIADEALRAARLAVTETLVSLETADKQALVPLLTNAQSSLDQPASYQILSDLVSTLPDKVATSAEIRKQQLGLLPKLCFLLAETSKDISFNALIDSICTILNNKVSLTTQHSIECVLSVLVKLTSRSSPALSSSNASHIFTRLCQTSRLVLLVHRNKLGGRSHMLLPLLQNLLFCLFMPTSTRSGALPSWLRANTPTEPIRLSPLDASQYAQLIGTLCNPPQSSISKSHQHGRKSKDLNDPIKAARERTSHFLYPLLASFCRFQLAGRLDAAVRVKLMPGIWQVVRTASLHKEGLDAMFAGLGSSERDVWRGVWGEWEDVHGRKERFVGAEES